MDDYNGWTVPTGLGREFRQFAGVQSGAVGVPGWTAAGRPAPDADPAPALPHGFRLDGRPAHDDAGRPTALAQLGRDPVVRLPHGHHRLHYRPPLRRCSS